MSHQSTAWQDDITSTSTPKKRKHQCTSNINPEEKKIIEKFEESLQKSLTEKAAKSNLSEVAVKSILKFVVTDEKVIAFLKQQENCEDASYEPKITRSKAKELSNSGLSLLTVQWDESNKTNSEVKGLLSDELDEDSSEDDEYIPQSDESEDDTSFCYSVSNPPTPSRNQSLLDEEIFKTPEVKGSSSEKWDEQNSLKSENDTYIALRTRSKLSLSQTPLEQIEQSFMPPDITNDMYDLECNDEDWKNFLSSFTQPLEEVVKNTEEEDLDPEYNILADEEITKVDTEELRDDRAVRVPRRELNDLMAELFEYVDIYEKRKDFQQDNLEINIDPNAYPIQEGELDRYIEIFDGTSSRKLHHNLKENEATTLQPQHNPLQNIFSEAQFKLLEQQMCQHVQMLTQNFILTFNHPYFSEYAIELKEYLFNFKLLSEGQEISTFNTINLKSALELMEKWEKNFENQTEEAIRTVQHFNKVMEESIQYYNDKRRYYTSFPVSIMKMISESDVFIYPHLLPKKPFEHPDLQKFQFVPFSLSENTLVALGLEQFIQHLKDNQIFTSKKKRLNIAKVAEIIQNLLMPARKICHVYKSINENKRMRDPKNPISFYFKNERAPFSVHQVIDLDQFGIVPPKERPASLLPKQWRSYIQRTYSMNHDSERQIQSSFMYKPKVLLNLSEDCQPQVQEPVPYRKILPKGIIPEIVPTSRSSRKKNKENSAPQKSYLSKGKFKKCFYRTTPYVKYVGLKKDLKFLRKYFPQMVTFESEEDRSHKTNTYLASIARLAPFDPLTEKKKREDFSLDFMRKLKETLGLYNLNEFLEVLIDNKVKDAVDLYRKLWPVLIPEYQDLADEFLLFLTKEQADAVGQLIPFFIMNHMAKFLDNLKLFLKRQSTQLQKIYERFQDLSDTPDVNVERIKSTILEILKSNPLLCDRFLQIFLEESPITSFDIEWNMVDVNKKLNRAKEEGAFESLVTNDDSGSTCTCPKSEGDVTLEQHFGHCDSRCTKEKVKYQSSKHMKPLDVDFDQLALPKKKRCIDRNEMSNSYSKGIQKNDRTNIENNRDFRRQKVRVCKPSKETTKTRRKCLKTKTSRDSSETNGEKSLFTENSADLKVTTMLSIKEEEETTPISKTDRTNLPSSECIDLTACDSDHPPDDETTFSKTLIEKTMETQESVIEKTCKRWTREEDRILLETFKQNFNQDPISLIKKRLKNRSETEILSRFDNLMNLLEEIYLKGDREMTKS